MQCECPVFGWCERRGRKVNVLLHKKCQQGHGEIVDRLLLGADSANPQPRQPTAPDVSTIGTQLQDAFETAIGQRISCGTCLQFLRSLNKMTEHDHANIVDRITAEMPIPGEIRRQYPRTAARREWVRSIVVPIVPQPVETAPANKSEQPGG